MTRARSPLTRPLTRHEAFAAAALAIGPGRAPTAEALAAAAWAIADAMEAEAVKRERPTPESISPADGVLLTWLRELAAPTARPKLTAAYLAGLLSTMDPDELQRRGLAPLSSYALGRRLMHMPGVLHSAVPGVRRDYWPEATK